MAHRLKNASGLVHRVNGVLVNYGTSIQTRTNGIIQGGRVGGAYLDKLPMEIIGKEGYKNFPRVKDVPSKTDILREIKNELAGKSVKSIISKRKVRKPKVIRRKRGGLITEF